MGNYQPRTGSSIRVNTIFQKTAALLRIYTTSTLSLVFGSNSLDRVAIDSSGNMVQDATNGGNLTWTKASTGLAVATATGITTAGSNLATATALTAVYNEISSNTAGQGVFLWTAAFGTIVLVVNGTTTPLTVYPHSASGTINSGSAGVAVTVSPGSTGFFIPRTTTDWRYREVPPFVTRSVIGITAAGATLAGATPLTADYNEVSTVPAATGVLLWDAAIGQKIEVVNAAALPLAVYPPTASGTINGGSAGVSVAVAAASIAFFYRISATDWRSRELLAPAT